MGPMVAHAKFCPKSLRIKEVSCRQRSFWYNAGAMSEPTVIPRAEHTLSRRDIDPDALKVLYRLRQFDHVAYLVGGSVRDLLLGRRPKDFDIGTSAHPYQVKKLFRNCWIIGRRFRLAHVKFGSKVIEVATFRRQLQPGEEITQDGVPAHVVHGEGQPAGEAADPTRTAAAASARQRPTSTCSIATTRSARRKRTPSAATSRSTPCSTTSRPSPSSTTPAGSRTCAPASCGASAIRRSASRKTRCACFGPSRWPRV